MSTYRILREFQRPLPEGDVIVLLAWSGNVRRYRASAFRDGKPLGRTGFCETEGRALAAAEKFLSRVVD